MKLCFYLLKKFCAIFIGALFLFTYAMVMLDTINNISSYITNKAPVKDILHIALFLAPKSMCMFAPVAVLFASAYVLSDMYAKNELIAVLASGVSIYKFTAPLIVMGGVLTFAFFFFEDKVAVGTYKDATTLQGQYINKRKKNDTQKGDQLVILSENARVIYHALDFDKNTAYLSGVIVIFRDENKELLCIAKAAGAAWNAQNKKWSLQAPTVYTPTQDLIKQTYSLPLEYADLLTELPSTFENNVTDIETVDIKTAYSHIKYLKRAGLPYTKEETDFFKKFASPCVIFLTVLLAIGLSGKTKQNVLITTLASCIAATAVFYVTQMITNLMSQFGYVNPFVGAWFSVVLFVFISLSLLKKVRT